MQRPSLLSALHEGLQLFLKKGVVASLVFVAGFVFAEWTGRHHAWTLVFLAGEILVVALGCYLVRVVLYLLVVILHLMGRPSQKVPTVNR